jgi:O-acetyl-ADP-ribose deacetylase (regulator of RNase III)
LIEIRKGDITRQPDIDAIVNAANTELWLGSGVAGAISAAGGPDIEEEAVSKGPIRLGQAVETTAGNLPNKYVIHAAAMGYLPEDQAVPKRPGSESSDVIIREATLNSLALAESLGCRSIAFPALATGVGGFPAEECAAVMLAAAQEFVEQNPASQISKIVFVLFGQRDYDVFSRALAEIRNH